MMRNSNFLLYLAIVAAFVACMATLSGSFESSGFIDYLRQRPIFVAFVLFAAALLSKRVISGLIVRATRHSKNSN
jgi:hypothetical protein